MKQDQTIQLHVLEHLDWDPSVNAANIGIKVKDGVVTLEGHVPSYSEKLAALEITKTITGVLGLVDALEVELIGNMKRSDSDIARAALQALEWDEVVPSNQVKVVMSNSHLTLEGELEWQYQRLAAEKTVRSLRGIKHLTNAITLRHRVSPNDVKAKIEMALKRTAESDSEHITVETHDGTAVLRGTVHSFAARDEAELAAWAAPGITWVEDHITIKPNLASL